MCGLCEAHWSRDVGSMLETWFIFVGFIEASILGGLYSEIVLLKTEERSDGA